MTNAKDIVPRNPSHGIILRYAHIVTTMLPINRDRLSYIIRKKQTHHVLELFLHGVTWDHGYHKADFNLVVGREMALVNKNAGKTNTRCQHAGWSLTTN